MRKLFFCLLLIFYSSFSYSQSCSGTACVGEFGPGTCILPCNYCADGICWVMLPVNLISYEVKEQGGLPVIRWTTTAEEEVHRFQIEIGDENNEHHVNYSLLTEIAPEGKNLSDVNNYSYTDFSFYASPKN